MADGVDSWAATKALVTVVVILAVIWVSAQPKPKRDALFARVRKMLPGGL